MATNPFNGFYEMSPEYPRGFNSSLSFITPFTHRTNISYAELLFELYKWLREKHLPELDKILKDFQEKYELDFENFKEKYQLDFDNLNTDIESTKNNWQNLFNQFMADIESELEALNDQAVANLVRDSNSELNEALTDTFVSNGEMWLNVVKKARLDGTDFTTALEAGLAGSNTNLFIPAGRHPMTRGVTMTSNKRIVGSGGKNATVLEPVIGWDSVAYPAVITMTGTNPALENIRVDSKNATGADCIRIQAEYEAYIGHVQTGGGANGINLLSGLETRIEHTALNGATGSGVRINDVPDCFLLNVAMDKNRFGLRAEGGSITGLHVHAIKSTEHGFYLTGPGSSQFYGCHADTNGYNGFHIVNATNTRMTDCWSFRNSANAPGSYHNWHINGAVNSSLTGCSSTEEDDVKTSFNFTGTVDALAMVSCHAGVLPANVTSGIKLTMCTGKLARFETHASIKRLKRAEVKAVSLFGGAIHVDPTMTNGNLTSQESDMVSPVSVAGNSTAFRYTSCSPLPPKSVLNMAGTVTAWRGRTPVTSLVDDDGWYDVDYWVTGLEHEFKFLSTKSNNGYLVWVDGQPVNRAIKWMPANDTVYRNKLSWTVNTPHHIRIRTNAGFIGVSHVSDGAVWKPEMPLHNRRAYFLGDSFTYGANAAYADPWSMYTADLLGWEHLQGGESGTGYQASSSGVDGKKRFIDRVETDIVPTNPDVVVILGSVNDNVVNLQTDAKALYAKLDELLPGVPVYVFGVQHPNGNLNQGSVDKDDALQIACNASPNVKLFTRMQGWITNANAPVFTSGDGTHPTSIGMQYYGNRVASAILKTDLV